MNKLVAPPAETYHLNTLASVIGRYAVPNISNNSLYQVGVMLEESLVELEDSDVPPVPHSNPVLLTEAITFDRKLLAQIEQGPAKNLISKNIGKLLSIRLRSHIASCEEIKVKSESWELFVDPDDIANAYGLADLWDKSETVIQEEVQRWGYLTDHPEVPTLLKQNVSLDETRQLMKLMWNHVVGVDKYPVVNTYLTDDTQNYHVYWSPLAEKLDYATPRTYDRATQLSYDLPHNATHLAHLDALDDTAGAARYNDNMALRAYFEAVTVFSEARTIIAAGSLDFNKELSYIFGISSVQAQQNLSEWIIADRKYEFKLRLARYAADVLMLEGLTFEESINNLHETVGINHVDAAKEIKKYLPWTGLGAVYTAGYRRLESLKVTKVMDAIKDSQGKAISSW